MIILNDSFRRVNARGGVVGGQHSQYPDAGRLIKADDIDSKFNFTPQTLNSFVGAGVIRTTVVSPISVGSAVNCDVTFLRNPVILFEIESNVSKSIICIRSISADIRIAGPAATVQKALHTWDDLNTVDNWDEFNPLVIWADAMYPSKTHTSTTSALITISSSPSFLKDQLIKRTANLQIKINTPSVTSEVESFGSWTTSQNQWQDLGGTIWEVYTSKTITDTASSLISLSSNSSFLKDKLVKRTANIAINIAGSATGYVTHPQLGTPTLSPETETTSTSFRASWNLGSNVNYSGLVYHEIQWYGGNTSSYSEFQAASLGDNIHSKEISGLDSNTQYTWRVRAYHPTGLYPPSDWLETTHSTLATTLTGTGVAAMRIAASSNSTIILGWNTSTVFWSSQTQNWEAN